jgi:hypothetical protein
MSQPLLSLGIPDPSSPEFLNWVRNELLRMQQALVPPDVVTNVRVTALPGSNQVDFTRSDGDSYILYINKTASINGAVRIELGLANSYVDEIGSGAVKRFYAVKAKKGNVEGVVSPWLAQTTLGLATSAVAPPPPPATQFAYTDQETDSVGVGVPNKGAIDPL